MKLQYALVALIASTSLVASSVQAQSPQRNERIRGTISAFDGHTLAVKSREGKDLKVTVPDNAAVNGLSNIPMSEIKPGSYIGTAATKQADGSLRALEVLVFPEAARGAGEGHGPWDLAPESTMTNATVSAMVQGAKGRELSLQYKGGTQKVVVPEGVPIVTFSPADRSLLVPGAHVFFSAQVSPDGSLSAPRITVGRDGVKPPM